MSQSKILFSIVVFFQLFGIKVLGVIDTSVIVLSVVLLLHLLQGNTLIRINKSIVIIYFVLLMITIYTIVVLTLYEVADNYSLFRLVRTSVSTFLVILYLQVINIREQVALRIIIKCLMIHAVLILLQLVVPEIKELSASLVGNNKDLVPVRSFGLVSAYDTAGAYVLIGMILSAYFVFNYNKISYFYLTALFWIAGMVTGRMFMVIGSFLFVIFIGVYLYKIRHHKMSKALIIIFSILFSIVFLKYAWPLLEASIRFVFEGGYHSSSELSEAGYYVGTLAVLSKHVFYPADEVMFIFGGAAIPGNSDIGYIKLIHSVGVFGILLYLLFYFMTYCYVRSVNKRAANYLYFPILLVILTYNFKMLTFMSRGYHELLIILMLLLVSAGLKGKKYVYRVAT